MTSTDASVSITHTEPEYIFRANFDSGLCSSKSTPPAAEGIGNSRRVGGGGGGGGEWAKNKKMGISRWIGGSWKLSFRQGYVLELQSCKTHWVIEPMQDKNLLVLRTIVSTFSMIKSCKACFIVGSAHVLYT